MYTFYQMGSTMEERGARDILLRLEPVLSTLLSSSFT